MEEQRDAGLIKTEFMLMACYGSVLISLEDFATDVMGVKMQTARNQIATGAFPVPLVKTSNKLPKVHITDVAKYINEKRKEGVKAANDFARALQDRKDAS